MTLADLARLTAADGAARLRPLRAPRQCRRDTLIARYGLDETMPDLLHLIAMPAPPRRRATRAGVRVADAARWSRPPDHQNLTR
jgi:hypothetical protein